jgi:SAM-dependent methyltransferase
MTSEFAGGEYFESRFSNDARRGLLWRTLYEYYFRQSFGAIASMVELGAGWCDFINCNEASERFAVDLWDGIEEQAAPGVTCHVGTVTELNFARDSSVDVVFASNLVEHLHRHEFDQMLDEVRRILKPGGRLFLLQPNYALCPGAYFHDYTHVSIWTDVSLSDYVASKSWIIDEVHDKFLPLSIKSRLPVSPLLIRAYLRSPVKPRAGQMLVVIRKPWDADPLGDMRGLSPEHDSRVSDS